MEYKEITLEQAKAFQKAVSTQAEDSPLEQSFLKHLFQVELYGFWGSRVWVGELDGKAVTINATRFSQGRSHDAWGKYASYYLAYTIPAFRCRGYASGLQRHVERLARDAGMDRLRSLAGSWAGFRLHYRLGHDFWGIADDGEILIDSPLDPTAYFPEGVPKRARKHCVSGARLTGAALIDILLGARFGRERVEVEAYLDDYGDGHPHHRKGYIGVSPSPQG